MRKLRGALEQVRLELGPDAWHNFRVDTSAALLFAFFNVVINQFYLTMALRAGATDFQAGLLAAAPAVGLMLSPIWASLIERSQNPRPYMIWPNLIGRTLILLPAFFGTPAVFVAVALAFQLLMGVQAPAYAALIPRMYPPRHRGRLMGNVRVAMVLLMIPMAYLVGWWMDKAGSGGPLASASVLGVLSILIFTGIRETVPANAASGGLASAGLRRGGFGNQWRLVRESRELGLFLFATTLTGFCNIASQPLYQIIQVDRLALSNVEIGWARIVYYVCLLASYLVVGWVIDRFSARRTVIWGLAAFSAVPALYAMFESYPAVLAGSAILAVGDAIWDIGFMTYVFRLAPGREAVAFGLHMMLFGIRGTIGPLLSTALSGAGLPMSVLLGAAALFGWAGVLLFLLLGRRTSEA
ncbi:MAG: MFS transporter [Thermobacillus sp. ZCTH02-B1]|uniref:MFS transporter n=1 Tax=Thermobacillus sp. ZCTH02-B1 TaxID=1858795 RepID=UPI000B56A16F|nr:MFS transporter [Thermobacillus sp. ZCTH02-B1]OUM96175.1 MAG: MFS transporter [Thermobacillus sp. ZCTH02-B1]